MMWFCGGHGVCLTGTGPAGHIEAAVIAWLRATWPATTSVDTGPGFEWLADDALWRSAAAATRRRRASRSIATGSGTLAAQPGRRGLRHAARAPAAPPTRVNVADPPRAPRRSSASRS